MTASELLALAWGLEPQAGDQRCFYCAAGCDRSRPAKIKGTFTDWASVANHRGRYQCAGCELATREKCDDIPGRAGRARQKMRTYSWLITRTKATAWTKADKAAMSAACVEPPEPPYAIAIGDGKRHLIFRAPVNWSRETITVQIEADRATYAPADLAAMLSLGRELVAGGVGQTRLLGPCSPGNLIALGESYGDRAAELAQRWQHVRGQTLWRLAAFLTPGKGALV